MPHPTVCVNNWGQQGLGKTIEEDSSFVSKISLRTLCKRAKLSFVQFKVLFLTLISVAEGVEGELAENTSSRMKPVWAGLLELPPTDHTGINPLGGAVLHRDDSTLITIYKIREEGVNTGTLLGVPVTEEEL